MLYIWDYLTGFVNHQAVFVVYVLVMLMKCVVLDPHLDLFVVQFSID